MYAHRAPYIIHNALYPFSFDYCGCLRIIPLMLLCTHTHTLKQFELVVLCLAL